MDFSQAPHKTLEKYGRLYIMTWHFYEQSFTMTKAFGFKLKMNLGDFDIYVKESV